MRGIHIPASNKSVKYELPLPLQPIFKPAYR